VLGALLSPARRPTSLYTLALHDALPIFGSAAGAAGAVQRLELSSSSGGLGVSAGVAGVPVQPGASQQLIAGALGQLGSDVPLVGDRKSTRLNSSHVKISYAVFCLKKKTA